MSTKATGNKKHLTLADRAAIEHGISRGENFTQIACRINKDSSTISKEIRRHLFRVPHFQNETQRKRSECEHFQNCVKQHICGNQTCNSLCWKCRPKRCSMYCPDFTPRLCEKLKKPPTCVMTALRYATVPTTSISTGPIMPTIFTVKQNLLHGLGLTRLLSPWNSWIVWFPLCFCRDSLCPISLLLIRNPSLVL